MRLGRYTLVGKLGAGAMAEVHAARLDGPGGFSRRVAIKRIRPHLVRHPGVYEMLVGEGRLCAVLEHHAILQVSELLDEGGEFGLVMEYADLGSLDRLLGAARMNRRPIPWTVVVAIGAEVASAPGRVRRFVL
jgi:serine/threonine-protein kinase